MLSLESEWENSVFLELSEYFSKYENICPN